MAFVNIGMEIKKTKGSVTSGRTAGKKTFKWVFKNQFRSGAYGWKGSRLACQRVREAVSEIKKVARKNHGLAAEGAICLIEKLSPALQNVNTSSGSLGSPVGKALDEMIPLIIHAPSDAKTRDKWLKRLWDAFEDDDIGYLEPVGDRWGELCGSVKVANQWAEELVPTVRLCWTDPNPGGYFHGTTACLSCLLMAGRCQDVLDLLALGGNPSWHYRRYGVKALMAMGKESEALEYAEASRGPNLPDWVIDQACEEVLISSGLHDEAYRSYGLLMDRGNSYLARFRALAKRYPMRAPAEILTDLVKTTPGEEGKWFATAKSLKFYDFALKLANQSPCEPKTLTRAAKNSLESAPGFAFGSALSALRWLNEGWGYEVTTRDVIDAYDLILEAAAKLDIDNVPDKIRTMLEQRKGIGNDFVRYSLSHRLRIPEPPHDDRR